MPELKPSFFVDVFPKTSKHDCVRLSQPLPSLPSHRTVENIFSQPLTKQNCINYNKTLHYRLRGSIGKKKFFFLNWLAFAHFWSNFDEIFCAGVKP